MSGLIELISAEMNQEPGNGDLYVFRSKRRKSVKMILWQDDGFWLLQKRFEDKRFRFPSIHTDSMELNLGQLQWLLSGFSVLEAPKTQSGPTCFF